MRKVIEKIHEPISKRELAKRGFYSNLAKTVEFHTTDEARK